jgi:DNA-binding transcriptional LysR family regulator
LKSTYPASTCYVTEVPGGSHMTSTSTSIAAGSGSVTPQGVELRHLRYFVAVADAGTFTHAAEQMFIAQPTLSQQIRRLEEIVGTPLLQRRREGVRLTKAGGVLLEASRAVLSLVDHGVNLTRQAAGLGRPHLRFVLPPDLPEDLAVSVASLLRRTAAAAEVDVTWIGTTLDRDFSPVRQRRADAGLGWLTAKGEDVPAPLEVMSLGNSSLMCGSLRRILRHLLR